MKQSTRFLMGLLVAAWSSTTWAQQAPSGGEVKKLKYDFAPIVIKGNVEKPQVQYVISREKLRDEPPLDLKESFLDRVVKAAEKEPF